MRSRSSTKRTHNVMLRLFRIRSSGRTSGGATTATFTMASLRRASHSLGTRRRGPTSRPRGDDEEPEEGIIRGLGKARCARKERQLFCCCCSVFDASQHTLLRPCEACRGRTSVFGLSEQDGVERRLRRRVLVREGGCDARGGGDAE